MANQYIFTLKTSRDIQEHLMLLTCVLEDYTLFDVQTDEIIDLKKSFVIITSNENPLECIHNTDTKETGYFKLRDSLELSYLVYIRWCRQSFMEIIYNAY